MSVNTHKQLRTKALEHPDVKAKFDELSVEYALLDELLKARVQQGLKQAQVAEKFGTTPPTGRISHATDL